MKRGHVLQLALLSLIWGSSYLLIKVTVAGVSPLTLVAGRIACGALVLAVTCRALRLRLPRLPSTWVHLAVMALLGNVLPFLLIAWAEQRVASSLASVLSATIPICTLIFAASVFRTERWTAPGLSGLALGFAGVGLLTGANLIDLGSASGRGTLALLLSSLCYGFSYAYARRFVIGNPIVLATGQVALATVMIAPVALVFGDPLASALTPGRALAWLTLGAVGTGAAYILYYRLIAAIGASGTAYTTYLIPVVGVAWGWLLLGERLGSNALAGVALVLLGVAVAVGLVRRPRRRIVVAELESGG